MTILGTDDTVSPYEGLVWGGESYYVSADDMHAYWANYNNTDDNPVTVAVDNINLSDGSTVDRRMWLNGDNCVAVEELRVNGGGHDWPGLFGNMDINSDIEIWNFVSQYDLSGLINCNANTSIQELNNLETKTYVKTIDILGRLQQSSSSTILFSIHTDGSVEKNIILK